MVTVLSAVSLLLAVALRFAHQRARGRRKLTPSTAGLLAGGSKRALQATLVTMRLRGEIGVEKAGVLRRASGLSETDDALERSIYRVLAYPLGPAAIRTHRRTIETFDALRRNLTNAGLLLPRSSWWLLRLLSATALGSSVAGFITGDRVAAGVVAGLAVVNLLLPRRTLAGSRLLRELARALPNQDEQPDPTTAGIAIALHGTDAVPSLRGFVERGGLLDGGNSNTTPGTDPTTNTPSFPITGDPSR